ncbi:MAG: hypothetical protein IJ677_02995 [Alphaproteobacteria bacterium]|nr:hypothetical protein [Alphaproteobacteria bacterium]
MKNILQKVRKMLVLILKYVIAVFVVFLVFTAPMIIYWEIEENKNISECIQQGETYDDCYHKFNW